mmetsp:Transcript_31240/g.66039  ORF Transcript_31240/g.66039 Transcript_31240/m.66039 type:complete len:171 (+) Transcript_31240:81-593(+)
MTMYSILLLLANVLAFYVEGIYGFTIAPIPPSLGRINTVTTQTRITTCHGVIDENNGVQEASLAGLGDDHEVFGESMAKSIALWLDDEWMPQEVHVRMGATVKATYIQCRKAGVDDVASIMTQVTDDLYERWSEYDKDAFVNAWDIGNYVADYLISKSGSETCACSNKIY